MKRYEISRGFRGLEQAEYIEQEKVSRVVQESSAVGDYEDSLEKPGSSFLWLGEKHHLDREEVAFLVEHLSYWLETGRLYDADL